MANDAMFLRVWVDTNTGVEQLIFHGVREVITNNDHILIPFVEDNDTAEIKIERDNYIGHRLRVAGPNNE